MKKFYKSVEDIVLFPGTLSELNAQERLNQSGRVYQLMPAKDSVRDIGGFIIPEQEEITELTRIMFNAIKDDYRKMVQEILENMNNFYEKIQEGDIRLRAKKLGANGLIHVMYQEKASIEVEEGLKMYIPCGRGLPVQLKK